MANISMEIPSDLLITLRDNQWSFSENASGDSDPLSA